MNLSEHYKVISFDDFKSNFMQVREIKAFLENKNSAQNICVITGQLCSGKSTIIDILSKNNMYESIVLTNESNYEYEFNNFVTKKTLISLMNGIERLVLIDDIHLMDKSFIKTLKKYKSTKIIVTILAKEESKIADLKGVKVKTLFVRLKRITFQDCFVVVDNLLESIGINLSANEITDIVKSNNCNIRQIFQYLGKNTNSMKPNFNDMNIYEITEHFLKNNFSMELLSMNISNIISFILYENLPNLLDLQSKNSLDENIKRYQRVLNNCILLNTDELNQDYSITKTIFDHYTMNRLNRIFHETDVKSIPLKFTTIFNKLSIQSSFNKKLINLANTHTYIEPYIESMCKKDVGDFLYEKLSKDFMK